MVEWLRLDRLICVPTPQTFIARRPFLTICAITHHGFGLPTKVSLRPTDHLSSRKDSGTSETPAALCLIVPAGFSLMS